MKNKSRLRQLTSSTERRQTHGNAFMKYWFVANRYGLQIRVDRSLPCHGHDRITHIVRTGHGPLKSVSVTGATAWGPSNV